MYMYKYIKSLFLLLSVILYTYIICLLKTYKYVLPWFCNYNYKIYNRNFLNISRMKLSKHFLNVLQIHSISFRKKYLPSFYTFITSKFYIRAKFKPMKIISAILFNHHIRHFETYFPSLIIKYI